MSKELETRVIQGDDQSRDGHYRPKQNLRKQSGAAKAKISTADSSPDALLLGAQNPI